MSRKSMVLKTLASLKPKISLALSSFLDELCSIEGTKTMPVSNVFPYCSADERQPILVLCSVQKLPVASPTLLMLWIAVICLSMMADVGHTLSQLKN